MRKLIALALLGLALAAPAEQPDYETYQDMRARFGELYAEEKFEEGAELLLWARKRFPDQTMANSYNLAICQLQLERPAESVAALAWAHEKDFFYGSYALLAEFWAPLRGREDFAAFEARNEELRAAAQAEALPELTIVTPEGYDPTRPYPLFIALHGGGGNVEGFQPAWTSPRLRKEFIVAYPQSSRVVGMNAYSWTEDMRLSRREVDEAYQKVLAGHRVDKAHVIVGGFSSGGVTAIELAAAGTLPMAGIVSLCPPAAEGLHGETAAGMRERGLRAVLLSTERDGRLDQQRAMVELMETAGVPVRLVVTPDIGHWFPEDLDAQIDEAIAFIFEE